MNNPEKPAPLTEEQKQRILDLWNSRPLNPPSIRECARAAYNREVDARTIEGKIVREFLATRSLRAPSVSTQTVPIVLTNEQKEFITNNIGTMNSLEIAKTLFNNNILTNTSLEAFAVREFLESTRPPGVAPEEGSITITWKPCNKMSEILVRVNRYASKNYEVPTLKPIEKKNFTVLMDYIRTYRFRQQISTYTSLPDQELFESEFIRCTYDKSDLSAEEIDQYIIYSTEVVISRNILRSIELFQSEQEHALESEEKINMALVEATSSLRKEYNECVSRQQKLLAVLTQKRSERLSKQIQQTASVLTLVEEMKLEEGRKRLTKIGQMREELINKEFDRLDEMTELKAKLIGIDRDLALRG